ncbi:hypothetical protein CN192_11650 [Sinorhizobium medicae]|nr:hypothetical protein CN192_11650 [Sinorhizobium medicae]
MDRTTLIAIVMAAVTLTGAAVALLLSHVHEHEAPPPAFVPRARDIQGPRFAIFAKLADISIKAEGHGRAFAVADDG